VGQLEQNRPSGAEAHTHFADGIGPTEVVPFLQSHSMVLFSEL
jgi:hypothetical protein